MSRLTIWCRMAGEDGRDLETPVLQKILDEKRVERVPVPEVLKRQPKRILLTVPAATARTGTGIPGWHVHLHLWHHRAGNDTRFPVGRRAPADRAGFHAGYYRGRLLDVIGRKRAYMSGCVIMAIFGFVYYALLETQIP